MPQQVQARKVQGRNSAESFSHWLVWCYPDVLFCLQSRGGWEAVFGPSPWRYFSTGLFQDVEETTVFSTDMFYEEGGLSQLLNCEIFFLILFSVSIVSILGTRYHVTQALSCKFILFFDYISHYTFVLPLHQAFVPLDSLGSTLMSYVHTWSIYVKTTNERKHGICPWDIFNSLHYAQLCPFPEKNITYSNCVHSTFSLSSLCCWTCRLGSVT